MPALNLRLYRFYFALRGRLAASDKSRLPRFLQKAKRAVRVRMERFFLPKERIAVRVRSGLSHGLWIFARLPEEAAYWQGQREVTTEQTILATVREGAVVYDVGAHIGSIALGMARLVGETGRVVAFDADPENVASLREACRLNQFGKRVEVVHSAVWSRSTNDGVPFRRGATRRSHGGVAADGYRPVCADGEIVTVPSTTLDTFIAAGGFPPEFVKIDVEGGEYEVLRGGENLFTRRRPRIIVEVHHADALEKIGNWIEQFRYAAEWRVPLQGFPRMLFAWPMESRPDL